MCLCPKAVQQFAAIHTYIHIYIHANMHAYMHANIHKYVHAYGREGRVNRSPKKFKQKAGIEGE